MTDFFSPNEKKDTQGSSLIALNASSLESLIGSTSVSTVSTSNNQEGPSGSKDGSPNSSGYADGNTMDSLLAARKLYDDINKHPLLVYFILDVTSSRSSTRLTMLPHETKLAEMVLTCGGKRAVVCKGVFYCGGSCSEPKELKTQEEIAKFFGTLPVGGTTRIAPALKHYRDDPTDAILSLAILIGDTLDGDNADDLYDLARQLGEKKTNEGKEKAHRPVVIAYENTKTSDSTFFCETVAPQIASLSGGHAFKLSTNPDELIALLDGHKNILSATPEELQHSINKNASGRPGRSTLFNDALSEDGHAFLLDQAKKVIVHALPPAPGH